MKMCGMAGVVWCCSGGGVCVLPVHQSCSVPADGAAVRVHPGAAARPLRAHASPEEHHPRTMGRGCAGRGLISSH